MFKFPHRSRPSTVRDTKPETSPTAPSHTAGVKQGNARGNLKKQKGLAAPPEAREPIDPRMPNLPAA